MYIGITIIAIAGGMIIFEIVTYRIDTCNANPLKTAADTLADGRDYSYARLEIYTKHEDVAYIDVAEIGQKTSSRIPLNINLTNFSLGD